MTLSLPAAVVRQIEAEAKERGETVAGWCRAKIIVASALVRRNGGPGSGRIG